MVIAFADDTTILLKHAGEGVLAEMASGVATRFYDHMNVNGLVLNDKETKLVLLGRRSSSVRVPMHSSHCPQRVDFYCISIVPVDHHIFLALM